MRRLSRLPGLARGPLGSLECSQGQSPSEWHRYIWTPSSNGRWIIAHMNVLPFAQTVLSGANLSWRRRRRQVYWTRGIYRYWIQSDLLPCAPASADVIEPQMLCCHPRFGHGHWQRHGSTDTNSFHPFLNNIHTVLAYHISTCSSYKQRLGDHLNYPMRRTFEPCTAGRTRLVGCGGKAEMVPLRCFAWTRGIHFGNWM